MMFSHEKSGCSYLPREGIVAARALNFRVRNGIGCVRLAIAAAAWKGKHPPETECHSSLLSDKVNRNSAYLTFLHVLVPGKGKGQSPRAIGASWLCSSRCLHRTSIEPLAWRCPYSIKDGRPSLGRGFALRCSQRLSRPRAAFRRCHWRDNRTTVAAFPLVLAY